MVKLSEIIRKSAGTKYKEEPTLISDAFEIKSIRKA
jgi:hypothetical protein